MPRTRSSVLRGRISQRDRARKRRKDRPSPRSSTPTTSSTPHAASCDALREWIREQLELHSVDDVARLDLREFLRATEREHRSLEPDERLRMLAIEAEGTCCASPQPRGWRALDRIYKAALALCSTNSNLHASRAIGAQQCMEAARWSRPPRPELARAIFEEGRAAALEAIARAPDDVHAYSVLAQLHYFSEHASAEQTLAHYERALEVDPTCGWSLLYRAHCLHDLGRWAEAADAYEAVPRAHYQGRVAWRYVVALEQRADCLLRAGRRDEALAGFRDLLGRLARAPALVERAALTMLVDAARGSLREQLYDEVTTLLGTHQRSAMLRRLRAVELERDSS